YIISLNISYCVVEPVKPAIVITADNLGTVDQTNANNAGLPVTIFPAVAEALKTGAPQAAAADANADCCRIIPPPDPAPEAPPPDRADLFGTSAYRLALTPGGNDAETWSPQLRGIYLNGVLAASVETRMTETSGASSGAPDQTFRLFANPVDPASLDLRVAE